VTFGDGRRRAIRDVDAVVLENLLSHLGKGEVSAEIGDGSLQSCRVAPASDFRPVMKWPA
jgi:hypothetical protein